MHGTSRIRKPDILFVTRHYSPEPNGSAPVLKDMAEAFAEADLAVDVLTVRPSYPLPHVWDDYANGQRDKTVERGVHVRRLPTSGIKDGSLLARLVPEARFALAILTRALTGRTAKQDRLISLCPSILTVTAALALKKRGGMHIAIVHDIPSGFATSLKMSPKAKFLIIIMKKLEAWTFNRVDSVVVLSEAMKSYLQGIGVTTPIAVVPPHVDTDELFPSGENTASGPALMYSGNIGRKQGIEQLVALAAELKNRHMDVPLIIKGTGNQAESLRSQLQQKNLTNARMEPFADRHKIRESLVSGDIHLVPQLPEGGDFAVPSKVFSIMAVGRPFIATAENGSPLWQLMEQSKAFICVPPNNASRLCDAVQMLLTDPNQRATLGRNGRQFVVGHASRQAVLNAYLKLLGMNPLSQITPERREQPDDRKAAA